MTEALNWLSGDLPGWVGVIVSISTLGSGGFVGGRAAAIARVRLDDRRELLSIVLAHRLRMSPDWSRETMLPVADIARRLPHSERRLVLDLIDEKRKNLVEERDEGGRLLGSHEEPSPLKTSDRLARYLELSVNPSFLGRINRRKQAIRIWCSGPLGSRQALWEAQERYRASEEILRECSAD